MINIEEYNQYKIKPFSLRIQIILMLIFALVAFLIFTFCVMFLRIPIFRILSADYYIYSLSSRNFLLNFTLESIYTTGFVYPPIYSILFIPFSFYGMQGDVFYWLNFTAIVAINIYVIIETQKELNKINPYLACVHVFNIFIYFQLIIGNIQMVILFLIVKAIKYLKENKVLLSSVLFAFSAFKIYPIVMIFLLIYIIKENKDRIKFTLYSVGILAFIFSPLLIPPVLHLFLIQIAAIDSYYVLFSVFSVIRFDHFSILISLGALYLEFNFLKITEKIKLDIFKRYVIYMVILTFVSVYATYAIFANYHLVYLLA